MTEIYGSAWVNQYGDAGGSAWQTWCRGLAGYSIEQIRDGVNRMIADKPRYAPNLVEFAHYCDSDDMLPDVDSVTALIARALSTRDSRLVSRMTPGVYFVYRQVAPHAFEFLRKSSKDARRQIVEACKACRQADSSELIPAPIAITHKHAPASLNSEQRDIARKCIAELRAKLSSSERER